jgi:elongation factor G
MGDVLGDLSARRGHILGTEPAEDGETRIRAMVPQAELHDFASAMQSMTQGHARFHRQFSGYEEAPAEVVQRVTAAADPAREEELVAH